MLTPVMWAIGGVCTAGFVISFIRDPRRLRNGVLLLLAVLAVLAAAVSTPGPVDDGVRATVLSLIVVVGLLGYLALVVFLLANGVLVIRREGRSVALALPLATAIVLIAIPAIVVWGISKNGTPGGFFAVLPALLALGVAGYLGFVLLSFVTYGALYRMRTRTPSSGAVLILGSRIFDGKVPPLLAARLNRAIQVFRQREARGLQPPVLVCCGGQGPDESRSEAAAMADYLIEQGVPATFVHREEKSTTTRQNLVFGSAIAEALRPGEQLLISTNDYHTFRTALLARALGSDAQVIAARTARYYVPAAFLREYVAILRDYLRWHLAALALFAIFVGFLVWESFRAG